MNVRSEQSGGQQWANTGPQGPVGPAGPPGPGANLVQTQFAKLALDSTKNTNVYSALLTIAIVTTGGDLICHFSTTGSSSSNNAVTVFALFIDGVQQIGAGQTSAGANHHDATSIVFKKTGLAAAAHNIEIRWKTDAGTYSCLAASDEKDSATLLVEEVLT